MHVSAKPDDDNTSYSEFVFRDSHRQDFAGVSSQRARSAAPLDAHLEFGHKAAELLVPVVECGRGRDDEERAPDVVSLRDTEYKSLRERAATGRPGGTFHESSCH